MEHGREGGDWFATSADESVPAHYQIPPLSTERIEEIEEEFAQYAEEYEEQEKVRRQKELYEEKLLARDLG